MTREKAINLIRYGIIEGNYPLPKELGIEACEMAIKALEQEPCEDCISRDEAIRVAEQGQIQGYEWQFKKLCSLPSATLQPKTGRWYNTAIQGEIDGQIIKSFICSECSAISVFRMAEGKIVNGDLCPNCGAKMEEVEENDD